MDGSLSDFWLSGIKILFVAIVILVVIVLADELRKMIRDRKIMVLICSKAPWGYWRKKINSLEYDVKLPDRIDRKRLKYSNILLYFIETWLSYTIARLGESFIPYFFVAALFTTVFMAMVYLDVPIIMLLWNHPRMLLEQGAIILEACILLLALISVFPIKWALKNSPALPLLYALLIKAIVKYKGKFRLVLAEDGAVYAVRLYMHSEDGEKGGVLKLFLEQEDRTIGQVEAQTSPGSDKPYYELDLRDLVGAKPCAPKDGEEPFPPLFFDRT